MSDDKKDETQNSWFFGNDNATPETKKSPEHAVPVVYRDETQPVQPTTIPEMNMSLQWTDPKTVIIAVLAILVLLSTTGINLLQMLVSGLQSVLDLLTPLIKAVLGIFGFSLGTLIGTTSSAVTSTVKTSADVVDGALQDVEEIIKDSTDGEDSNDNGNNSIMKYRPISVRPDDASSSIQQGNVGGKAYCLVGEFNNTRHCMEVKDSSKCMSGQLFPSQTMCLNPSFGGKASV